MTDVQLEASNNAATTTDGDYPPQDDILAAPPQFPPFILESLKERSKYSEGLFFFDSVKYMSHVFACHLDGSIDFKDGTFSEENGILTELIEDHINLILVDIFGEENPITLKQTEMIALFKQISLSVINNVLNNTKLAGTDDETDQPIMAGEPIYEFVDSTGRSLRIQTKRKPSQELTEKYKRYWKKTDEDLLYVQKYAEEQDPMSDSISIAMANLVQIMPALKQKNISAMEITGLVFFLLEKPFKNKFLLDICIDAELLCPDLLKNHVAKVLQTIWRKRQAR